ncbi:unnamed protein product, partial [Rangifer tarandus platyrhynchus]
EGCPKSPAPERRRGSCDKSRAGYRLGRSHLENVLEKNPRLPLSPSHRCPVADPP